MNAEHDDVQKMKKAIAASVLIFLLVLSCNISCRGDGYGIGVTRAHASPSVDKRLLESVASNAISGVNIGSTVGAFAAAKAGTLIGGKVGSFLGPPVGTIVGGAIGALGGMAYGYFSGKKDIAAETAKAAADRELKAQVASLMRERGMTQQAIKAVYNDLRNQQAKSREEILAAVSQALAKIDATQEQIAELSTKLCDKMEEMQKKLLQATEEIKQGQQLIMGRMEAVDKRMQEEFKILGADLENKHAAQMAAISAKLQAIKVVDE